MDPSLPATERRRPALADLDQRDTVDLVRLFASDTSDVAVAVDAATIDLATAVDRIASHLAASGGRLVYVGAGTAGRMGLLDASECGPTFNTDRVLGILAGGDDAFENAVENLEDDAEAARRDLARHHVSQDDAVVGVSASGSTAYTVAGVAAARELGAITVGVSSNPDTLLVRAAEHGIVVATGPEIITGSTRLKAGTAQKVVCNAISTTVMVRLNKTYGDLMVDVRPSNAKLRDRAARIVSDATGVDADVAAAALGATDGDVKVAIIIVALDVTSEEAVATLAAANGSLRDALEVTR